MTFFQFAAPQPGQKYDYPTLGFFAADGAILDGTASNPAITTAPDAHWTAVASGPESGITRYRQPQTPPDDQSSWDGSLLVYDATVRAFVRKLPSQALAPGSPLDAAVAPLVPSTSGSATAAALSAAYAGISMPMRTASTRLRAVAVGDSTCAGGLADTAGVTVQVGNSYSFPDRPIIGEEKAGMQSWFTHACLRSGGRLLNVHNAGVHGDTSAGILNRYTTDVLNYKPDVVLISGGIHNDLNNNVPVATSRANIVSMIRQAITAGIIPILVTCYPENGTQSVAQGLRRHNTWLKVLAAGGDANYPDVRGLIVVDPYSAVVDTTSTTGAWVASYTQDGTHASTAGAIVAGDKILADLAGLLRGNTAAGPFAATDAPTSSVNALANPLMLNDTNADGKADSWSANGTNLTWSLVTDAAIIGKAQSLNVTSSGSSSFYQQITVDGTNFAVGDKLKWSGWVKATAAAGSLNWYMQIGNLGGTAKNAAPFAQTVGMDYGWSYYECEYVIPTGATALRAGGYVVAGTGTLLIAQQSLVNLTKL